MDYLIYILIGWGITDFLVNGSILDQTRVYFLVKAPLLAKLLTCIRCSGFWAGVLMGLGCFFGQLLSPMRNFEPTLQIICSGFLIGGSSVIINALLVYFYSPKVLSSTPPNSGVRDHLDNPDPSKETSENEEQDQQL